MLVKCLRGLILSAFLISLCFGKSIPDSKRVVQDVFTINNFGDCYYVESNTECYYDQYITLTISRSLLTGEVEYLSVEERYEQNPNDRDYYINFEYANQRKDIYYFLGSVVYLEEGDCDEN